MAHAKNFYDFEADKYEERHENETTKYVRKFEKNLIKKYAKGKTLDIGCGTGYHLEFMEKIGIDAVGLDISENMLNEAKGKGIETVVHASAENLPFSAESFDTITCLFTVLNLCDFEAVVSEMMRTTKKGGIVILSVSSIWDKLDIPFYKRIGKNYSVSKNVRIDGKRLRFHLFSKNHLIEIFSKKGFELVKFDSIFITQRPYWGWYRNFSNKEKIKHKIDRILPKESGGMYFVVFKKTENRNF